MNIEDLELITCKISEHIRFYVPKNWVGPIREFDFVPFISVEDAEAICSGQIPDDKKFNKWYIKDAINDWIRTKGTK